MDLGFCKQINFVLSGNASFCKLQTMYDLSPGNDIILLYA